MGGMSLGWEAEVAGAKLGHCRSQSERSVANRKFHLSTLRISAYFEAKLESLKKSRDRQMSVEVKTESEQWQCFAGVLHRAEREAFEQPRLLS
jgi:hypothetical protein